MYLGFTLRSSLIAGPLHDAWLAKSTTTIDTHGSVASQNQLGPGGSSIAVLLR